MGRYLLRRLLWIPLVLFLLVTLAFFLIKAAPGGPFSMEKETPPKIRENMERKWHLDEPVWKQYLYYLGDLARFDLGHSFRQQNRTVREVIAEQFPNSVILGVAALAIALAVGLTAGIVAAIRQNTVFDYSSMTVAMVGLATPTFVSGPLLVMLFAMYLGWFRVTGWDDFPRDLILPAITLSLPFAARIARLTRAGMLEIVNQDYIKTARSKGLSETVVIVRHALKGALLPVVSYLGPATADILVGGLVVERIFDVPGIGREFVVSAINRDYTLVLGLVLLDGVLLVFMNLLVDVVYGFLDPRIRYD
ncbi:MAG: ABC transporter permease subunit [Planctomycetes bacterium]|nr:ABC transporter permease subunit [Planctomycetota bacterium]